MTLAHAITIHKAQGLTLDKVIVHLGKGDNTTGLTYVALSRTKRSEDIMMIRTPGFKRFDSIRNNVNFKLRLEFLNYLRGGRTLLQVRIEEKINDDTRLITVLTFLF